MANRSVRFTTLDSLRGVFSLCVVFFHSPEYSVLNSNYVILNAYLFVDFFFVLSGFVLAHTYGNRTMDQRLFLFFLRKRFLRLYPLLLYTAIVYFLFRTAGILIQYHGIGPAAELMPDFLDTIFLCNSTPLFGSGHGINYPSWSISAEAVSYLIFATILFSFRKQHTTWVKVTLIVAAGVCLYYLGKGNIIFSKDYGFLRGIYGFFLGVIVYRIWSAFRSPLAALRYWTVLEVVYVVLLVAFFYEINRNRSVTIFIPLYFGLGVLLFAASTGWLSKLLNLRPAAFLGKISYSIYLNHAVVIFVVTLILHRLRIQPSGILWSFISPVITILYSALTYSLIEKRFYFSAKDKVPRIVPPEHSTVEMDIQYVKKDIVN